ncbi:MAG TPA: DoxX family protein [Bryobacteraceae bacterium]|nr:DoxX family protein [Bryobacteraceae bacterium]
MNKRNLVYWLSTSAVGLVLVVSGAFAAFHYPQMDNALKRLGYPTYFGTLLGTGKLAGVAVLLAPGLPRLKEWAYVASGIVMLSASYSHFMSGDGWLALEPLGFFGALIVSYLTRPASRRWNIPARVPAHA